MKQTYKRGEEQPREVILRAQQEAQAKVCTVGCWSDVHVNAPCATALPAQCWTHPKGHVVRTAGLRHHVMLLRHRQTRNCASLERAYTVSKRSGCEPSAGLLSSAICSSMRLRPGATATRLDQRSERLGEVFSKATCFCLTVLQRIGQKHSYAVKLCPHGSHAFCHAPMCQG